MQFVIGIDLSIFAYEVRRVIGRVVGVGGVWLLDLVAPAPDLSFNSQAELFF